MWTSYTAQRRVLGMGFKTLKLRGRDPFGKLRGRPPPGILWRGTSLEI